MFSVSSFSPASSNTQDISIQVIEPNKEMQRLLRAMLSGTGFRNLTIFSDTERAGTAMLSEPPDLILMEWENQPYDGSSFLKLIRNQNMFPLCLVPVVMMFSEPRKKRVERALKLGAHAVIAKPISPTQLLARIKWVMNGGLKLKLVGERYVIEGVEERLAVEQERHDQLSRARAYQESQFAEMTSIQNDVDKLLQSSF